MGWIQQSGSGSSPAGVGQQRFAENWRNGTRFRVNLAPEIDALMPVVIGVDDGYAYGYHGSLVADTYGGKMTLFVHTSKIGATTPLLFLTESQIQDTYARGHEIASHSTHNQALPNLTFEQTLQNFEDTNRRLENILRDTPYRCESIAYPMGQNDLITRQAAEQVYVAGRGGYAAGGWPGGPVDNVPTGSHIPMSMYSYVIGKAGSLEGAANDTLATESEVRAYMVTNLQLCVNAAGIFQLGGHNELGCTLTQLGYIFDEANLDGRCTFMTFTEAMKWARQRTYRDGEVWKSPYDARILWYTPSPDGLTRELVTGAGPRGDTVMRVTNASGVAQQLTFRHRVYGELMTYSAYVKSYSGSTVTGAVKLRNGDGDDPTTYDATTAWTRLSYGRTPAANSNVHSGFMIQDGKSFDIALPQLQVGALTEWVDPFPMAS